MSNTLSVAHSRLRSQRITGARFARAEEVVAWMGAVQAQDYLGALWAVGLRMRHPAEAAVEQALAARRIVRSWPLRGTLHFVAAADLRWLLALLAPRTIASRAGRYRQLEIDAAALRLSRDTLVRALRDGQSLSRDALYQVLEAAGVSTAGQRGIHLLGHLALEGLICFGARDGKQQTFTLLDDWLPPGRRMTRDESLAELARRYFTSHGMAAIHDFAWWAGLPLGDARAALALAESSLARELINGRELWYVPDSLRGAGAPPPVELLPAFDEYLVGYADRAAVLDPADVRRINAGGGMLSPAIIVKGQVAGIWKRTLRKDRVRVSLAWFPGRRPVSGADLRDALDRYGAFLGLPAELEE